MSRCNLWGHLLSPSFYREENHDSGKCSAVTYQNHITSYPLSKFSSILTTPFSTWIFHVTLTSCHLTPCTQCLNHNELLSVFLQSLSLKNDARLPCLWAFTYIIPCSGKDIHVQTPPPPNSMFFNSQPLSKSEFSKASKHPEICVTYTSSVSIAPSTYHII